MTTNPARPLKILLVDDDRGSYILTRAMLGHAQQNIDLHWRSNVESSIEALGSGEFDLCLLDYTLGDRTGIDLLTEIRSGGNRIPVIMLTGCNDHEIDMAAMNAGADEYLVKGTFDRLLLERSIRYAIERQRSEQALRDAHDKLELRVAERTAELRLAMEQLELAHAQQKQFVADASHDLRTPLTIVRGELDLLMENSEQNPRSEKSIRRAINAINRLDHLSNDLILLAHLDSRSERSPLVTHRLDEVLLESVSSLSVVSREKEISWQIDIGETLEVECDRHAMERAICNVLENAIKYSPVGSIIRVELQTNGSHARIIISDSGTGISAEELPRVFDRFYRSDQARSTQGVGLGLSIVKSVIEALNGSVSIGSEPGAGTTVTLEIPLKREHAGGGQRQLS